MSSPNVPRDLSKVLMNLIRFYQMIEVLKRFFLLMFLKYILYFYMFVTLKHQAFKKSIPF